MATKRLTLTLRDMYQAGTETVELQDEMVDQYFSAFSKSPFLVKLETVSFANPYVVTEKQA